MAEKSWGEWNGVNVFSLQIQDVCSRIAQLPPHCRALNVGDGCDSLTHSGCSKGVLASIYIFTLGFTLFLRYSEFFRQRGLLFWKSEIFLCILLIL